MQEHIKGVMQASLLKNMLIVFSILMMVTLNLYLSQKVRKIIIFLFFIKVYLFFLFLQSPYNASLRLQVYSVLSRRSEKESNSEVGTLKLCVKVWDHYPTDIVLAINS